MTPPQIGPVVRLMREEDVAPVAMIEAAAFTTPWSAETFSSLVDRQGLALMVLADPTDGIIGYAVLWCILDQGELANLAVAESHRGRGLGALLLRAVLDMARSRGVASLYLEVRMSNEAAIHLYQAYGFSDVGRRKDYYDRPKEDARVMLLSLGS